MLNSKTYYFKLREIQLKENSKDSPLIQALDNYHKIFIEKSHAVILSKTKQAYLTAKIQNSVEWNNAISIHAKNAAKRSKAKTIEEFDSVFKDFCSLVLKEAHQIPVSYEEAASVVDGCCFKDPAKIIANLPFFEYNENLQCWEIIKYIQFVLYCDWSVYERITAKRLDYADQIKLKKYEKRIIFYAGAGTWEHPAFKQEQIKGFDYAKFNRLSNPANLI